MVVAKKNRQSLRLSVDLTGVNVYVCCEKYILPPVEYSLGMLARAKKFSIVDANMGLWQILLTEESAMYTTFGLFHFNCLPYGIASCA